MVELTSLAMEADDLQSWVAEARWHADEAERVSKGLSVRSQRDYKEAAKVRKEQDELL